MIGYIIEIIFSALSCVVIPPCVLYYLLCEYPESTDAIILIPYVSLIVLLFLDQTILQSNTCRTGYLQIKEDSDNTKLFKTVFMFHTPIAISSLYLMANAPTYIIWITSSSCFGFLVFAGIMSWMLDGKVYTDVFFSVGLFVGWFGTQLLALLATDAIIFE